MQWLPTRFYGSLSVYSHPLPSEKIAPFAAQLKIAFRRFLFNLLYDAIVRKKNDLRAVEVLLNVMSKRSLMVVEI